jgi:hypothetical protein
VFDFCMPDCKKAKKLLTIAGLRFANLEQFTRTNKR